MCMAPTPTSNPGSHAGAVSRLQRMPSYVNRKADVLYQNSYLFVPIFCFIRPEPLTRIDLARQSSEGPPGKPLRVLKLAATGKRFGPVGSVQFGFRTSNSFRLFHLATLRSVSPFGLGHSVDESVRKRLQLLQLTDSSRELLVGLIIPWSQVRVLAGPPLPHRIHRVMSLRPRD